MDVEPVSITFNIWMSGGRENVFEFIAHGLDQKFQPVKVHLKMLQCENTSEVRLTALLKEAMDKFEISSNVSACVKNGGTKLEQVL